MALTPERRAVKTRYLVPLQDGLTAEADQYAADLAGVMTAEVEFPSADASAAFVSPDWLGREVTGDERYATRSLAVRGAPAEGLRNPATAADGPSSPAYRS